VGGGGGGGGVGVGGGACFPPPPPPPSTATVTSMHLCNDSDMRSSSARVATDAVVDDLLALTRMLVGLTARTLAALDTDVTLQQHRLLVLLAARGGQRTADLAAELGVHPSTVTRTCDRLVRRALVQRRHGEDDRRTVWWRLTVTGRDLVGEVMRRRAAEIRRLVSLARSGGHTDVSDMLRAIVEAAGEPSEAEFWRRWSVAAEMPTDGPEQLRSVDR
jgi:DNA-binding MarR family transcriptional regulator